MSDPIPCAQDFLNAELVVDHLLQNLAIECQLSMDGWDRETMQKHVNKRGALLVAKSALLDEVERLANLG